MKRAAAVLMSLLAAAPAGALVPDLPGFSAGVFQSFGTDKYRGTDVYAAVGLGNLSLAPELRRYEESGLGPRHALSARVGWDMRWFGFGVTAGAMPRKSGYDALFGGLDAAFTIAPLGEGGIRRVGGPSRGGAPVGKGLARVDFGGGLTLTRHRERAATERRVSQQEVYAYGGASVVGLLASARAAKFAYDKDPATAAVPSPVWSPLAGHLRYGNGFADATLNLTLEAPLFPLVAPFGSVTYTKYRDLGAAGRPADTKAYAAGLRLGLEMLALEALFQHVAQAGPAKERNYAGLGAQLRL